MHFPLNTSEIRRCWSAGMLYYRLIKFGTRLPSSSFGKTFQTPTPNLIMRLSMHGYSASESIRMLCPQLPSSPNTVSSLFDLL
jgi:hypothetical protein